MHVILLFLWITLRLLKRNLHQLIQNALAEDIGDGDHLLLHVLILMSRGKAILKIKDKGILAGVDVAEKIFSYSDSISFLKKFKHDGDEYRNG